MPTDEPPNAFFGMFASAMLERSLPAIRAWLTSRLGPRTKLDQVELDGSKVRVRDALIPLGARIALDVSEATFVVKPEGITSGQAPVRLERMDGRLTARDPDDAVVFEAPMKLVNRAGSAGGWVDADFEIFEASWRVERGVGEQAPLAGTARLVVNSDGWALDDGIVRTSDATVRIDAAGRTRDGEGLHRAKLVVDRARGGHFIDAIAAFTGQHPDALAEYVPWHARLDGTVELDRAGTLRADLVARTELSDAKLSLERREDGHIESAELTGDVAVGELPVRGMFAPSSRTVAIEARASGSRDDPRVELAADCARLEASWLNAPAKGTLRATRAPSRGWHVESTLGDSARLELSYRNATRGEASLSLWPGGIRILGAPLEGEMVQITGTLSAGGWAVCGDTDALVMRPADDPSTALRLRRVKLRGGREGAATDLSISARSGPGTVRWRYLSERSTHRLRADRIDEDAIVAIATMAARRAWRDARVPDGTQLWLDVEIGGGLTRGKAHVEGPRSRISFDPIRFDRDEGGFDGTRLTGTVETSDLIDSGLVRSRFGMVRDQRVEVEAEVSGVEPVLEARLRAKKLVHGFGQDTLRLTFRDARAQIVAGAGRFEVRGLRAETLGGRVELDARLARLTDGVEVTVERAAIIGLTDLAALGWSGPAAQLDASIRGTPDAMRGEIALRSERSTLTADLRLTDRRWDETTFTGAIDLRDVVERARGTVRLEGSLRGRFERPVLASKVLADELALSWMEGGEPVAITGLDAELNADRDGARVRLIEANVGGGELSGSAAIGFGAFVGYAARVELSGAELGGLGLEGWIEGRGFAEIAAFGFGAPSLAAKVRVEQPKYTGLDHARATFSRYGLLPLSQIGTAPLTAELRVEGARIDALHVGGARVDALHIGGARVDALHIGGARVDARRIRAAVSGAKLEGEIHRRAIAGWSGELRVVLERSWLETSHLLEIPARIVGDVTLPLAISGKRAPQIRPDTMAMIDTLFRSSGLRGVIDGLLKSRDKGTVDPEAKALGGAMSVEALLDEVAAGGARGTRAIGALLERGLSPEELVNRARARAT